jgi:DNA (cytosine-5)-methyltransferase 1
MTNTDYSFIDLFSGVGGFHFAMNPYARCVMASEWDSFARKTYALNFGPEMTENNTPFLGDITKINPTHIPDHTVLCGGFPCQPFSIAGKQAGFNHPTQGTLFYSILQIIDSKNPRVIFLENVKNLASHDGGNTFKIILAELAQRGYHVKHSILNGSTHGNVPQNRERVFIIGFKEQADYDSFNFPTETPLTTNVLSICDINTKADDKYYQTNMSSPSIQKMHAEIQKIGIIHQYRRYYVRENKAGVCPTLTANMGSGGHNVPLIKDNFGIRKLTPRECFSFQGFSTDFKIPSLTDSHLYKQAGNSVVVPVVSKIAAAIFQSLSQTDLIRKKKHATKNLKRNPIPLE